jgi:dynein heavy chain, axonemal
LEDIEEEIQDSYDDVLLNKKVKEGNVYKLKMREKIVDIHPDFRFYITTKLANPHFKPEICIKVTLLNFQLTLEGLED